MEGKANFSRRMKQSDGLTIGGLGACSQLGGPQLVSLVKPSDCFMRLEKLALLSIFHTSLSSFVM